MQWLRDGLRIIASAPESGALAAAADRGQDVYLVPAFVGLGAPYWQPEARGALFGLTRATGPNEIARAALEACATRRAICSGPCTATGRRRGKAVLRVDGGMVASDWTMQFLADILDAPVERPTVGETTALGAAWLAGHKAGVWPDAHGFGSCGSSTAPSRPRWRRPNASASTPAGSARWRRARSGKDLRGHV